MNAFDFDNTLYNGESAVDLALFMIKNNKRIILWLPTIFWNLLKYKLCFISAEKVERKVNDFLRDIVRDKSELLSLTAKFWKTHSCKLNKALLKKVGKDDVIITAGPDFLFSSIKSSLGTSNIICSEVDLDRKKVVYLNFGSNKVKKYRKICGDRTVGCFFTDSYNDKAMMDIAKKVFLVRNGRCRRIK